jgi:hypothetical protein
MMRDDEEISRSTAPALPFWLSHPAILVPDLKPTYRTEFGNRLCRRGDHAVAFASVVAWPANIAPPQPERGLGRAAARIWRNLSVNLLLLRRLGRCGILASLLFAVAFCVALFTHLGLAPVP